MKKRGWYVAMAWCLLVSCAAVCQQGEAPAAVGTPLGCVQAPEICISGAGTAGEPAQSHQNQEQPTGIDLFAEMTPTQKPSPLGQPTAQPEQPVGPSGTPKLTLHDAEQLALKNHPRITIGDLNALASKQVAREVRAAFFPIISLNATGTTAYRDGNRITAGGLGNTRAFEKAASGLAATGLITDFGRTKNLAAAANLNAQAQQETAVATREQIVFFTDQAFYDALSSDVLVKVAEQTVQARQAVANQIQALENAKLRSALDTSFANVALAQAQLLLVNAKNNRDAAYAILSEAMGLPNQRAYELVDTAPAQPPSGDVDSIIRQALENRPDVKAVELQQSAAERFATAEERLQLPDINAIGAAGVTPVASSALGTNAYGAVGVNIHVPVFNGFLFSARAAEAKLRAKAASERSRDLKDTVARTVRVAWLNMNSAFERENVAARLLEQATLSLNLAQARYNLGLSSIVELSQAQLQQTEAEISTVTAKYQYELAVSALTYEAGATIH